MLFTMVTLENPSNPVIEQGLTYASTSSHDRHEVRFVLAILRGT